ncbi:Cof-type HAD-IIB family hydrolase [Lederbergia sp. NSJ-179]|uniref:Cof-type HAD-IIB family hydrolase n=1 Tax=Lederbergia sp. NSJ-179 TaxID=2931402 RepID=UPI001FD0690C|nr:Cof-type HAD-IIB family hydrolase [Lederbergia sp. NSJ-179]MCJ7842749.1 Cof-type HAD-IIB family hydrolase [Lederbergia sp. NSJ-179]
MPNYKLLALDLDGTVLTDDKKITAETRRWIRKAVDEGVTVIFSTGRGIQTAGAIWDDLAIDAPMVLVNGAEIWKGPGEVWERYFISREDIRWLYEQAMKADAEFWGYSVESLTHKRDWTDEMFDRDWLKFGMHHPDLNEIQKLRELLQKRKSIETTRSAPINIEISLKGISKETGVRRVCELLGITMDQVMAVGDNMNDWRLLQAAGLGVAMGNADDELKQIADVVTDSNEEDGVAKAIQRYLLGTYIPIK